MNLECHSRIEGWKRDVEDRARILQLTDRVVIALADGAGGMSGAAEAAEIVVNSLVGLASKGGLATDAECLRFLRGIDAAIEADPIAGVTTGIVAVVSDDLIYGASVGDSKAWWIEEKTHVELTARQVRKPFLGNGEARPVSFSIPRCAGVLLAASDGLMDYGKPDEILATVRAGKALSEAARDLIELVRYPWGKLPDDVSVCLCRVG